MDIDYDSSLHYDVSRKKLKELQRLRMLPEDRILPDEAGIAGLA